MSKWVWILLISLGVVFILAAYIGIQIGKSFGEKILSPRKVDRAPEEYLDLLQGADSGKLEFLNTTIYAYGNPISRYRYLDNYEILETKLNFSDTGILGQKLEIRQANISFRGWSEAYDGLRIGRIDVDFIELNRPDTFKKISLIIEGNGFGNGQVNDSVVSYFMERGSFAISRSPNEVPSIYSSKDDGKASLDPSEPTALLFKRRGNSVFMLAATPIREQTELPKDVLIRLVGKPGREFR
jgi:hypothetical protein